MYSFQSAVRYSEVDEAGTLSIPALINYLQDCSTFQTEELGVGVGHAQEVGLRWLLAAWEIEIFALPRLAERIEVSTWARSFRGLFAGRNFTLRRCDGGVAGGGSAQAESPLVRADSLWFMYGDEAGRPVRPPASEVDPYAADLAQDAPLDMPPIQRRIPVEGPGTPGTPVTVTRAHIDTNHHVNNAQYVDMALASLPEGALPVPSTSAPLRLDVQYCEAARLGDVVHPFVHACEGGWIVSLADAAGKSYAVVRVRG